MRNIVVQSDMRAKDPVGGCYRIIQELQHEIESKQAELDLIRHNIAIYRAQEAYRLQIQKPASASINNMAVKPTVVLRAFLVGGVAVFAKVGGAMKAAGGAKLGAAAAAAMTVAAMSGSKPDQAVRLPSK
ncbi:hypothetical protein V6N11_047627 [Hibiscus sabdariffa]|uniref:LOB domain-containing protein n=1 Tax=Hibiscus sabdariffa TaxID=183260 RepID=A0ABR2NLI9_9ROSI